MPEHEITNIEKLAQSNQQVAHAMTVMAETLRESQAEMGRAVTSMAVDVATIRANSEHERSHRERLEEKLNTHARETRADIVSIRQIIAEDGKSAAVSAFKGKVMWGALCGAVSAAVAFAWHAITQKGG